MLSWDQWVAQNTAQWSDSGIDKEQIEHWQEKLRDLSFATYLILGVSKNWWSEKDCNMDKVPMYWSIKKNPEGSRLSLKPWTLENGVLISMIEDLDSKFAKLSYLFVEDFFVQKQGCFLNEWSKMSQKDNTIVILGPFNTESRGLKAQETLYKMDTGQVSALLALCQRMSKSTPPWLLEGLIKMDEYNLKKVSIEKVRQKYKDEDKDEDKKESDVLSINAKYRNC